MSGRQLIFTALAVALCAGTACTDKDEPKATESPAQSQQSKAVAAKDALFAKLSGRLMQVMKAEGPAAAVRVCANEAPAMAQAIGDEHGVSIGRTSAKLRNPKNAVPDWAKSVVERGNKAAEMVELPGGKLGAMFPIVLQDKCETCHGDPAAIDPAVEQALSELYPDDRATGFSAGDLRGWFWVEVPAG